MVTEEALGQKGSASFLRWALGVLALAALYFLTGLASNRLASTGYVTMLWPSAGIALAGILLLGWRAVPGVVLGQLGVVLVLFPVDTPWAIPLACCVAIGPAVQAVAGAAFLRRTTEFPRPFEDAGGVLRFLMIAGPLTCLISATWAVGLLGVTGFVEWSEFASTWFTWWVGDSIGVLIVVPLVRPLLPENRNDSSLRSVLLLSSASLVMCVLMFVGIRGTEGQRAEAEFQRRATHLADHLQGSCEQAVWAVNAIHSFLTRDRVASRAEFSAFAKALHPAKPALRALEWAPLVSAAERESFVAETRRDASPAFDITEPSPARAGVVRASERSTYYPVRFVEPASGNERTLGFDLGADDARLQALQRARDEGRAVSWGPVWLIQDATPQAAFYLILPVYDDARPHATVEERRASLSGFAVAVLRVADLMSDFDPGDAEGLEITIVDVTGPTASLVHPTRLQTQEGANPGEGVLDLVQGLPAKAGPLSWLSTLTLPGRSWELRINPQAEFLVSQGSWYAWGVLLGGLLFSGLIEAFLLMVHNRSDEIRTLVDARTAELSQANTDLEQEIAERERAQEQLERAKDAAEAATRAKSQFLATMSHEIRTPMNGVIGMTELLLDSQLDDIQRELAETVRSSSDVLLALVNDILSFSKIEAGAMQVERAPFELQRLVEEAVVVLAERAYQQDLELVCHLEPTLPARIVGDAIRLREVFVNLVSNAVKFTPKGSVTVRVVHGDPGWIRCSVADTGIGIPAEFLERLFDPFTQADGTMARRFGGTGLGLAICKRLVTLMGGTLEVTSAEGQGSVFAFSLPTHPEHPKADAQPLPAPTELAGRRILVVQPHPATSDMLVETLRAWDLQVVAVADERAGRKVLDSQPRFDVALIDGGLDGSDSVAFAKSLDDTPAVLLVWLPERQEKAEEADGVACLTKPVRREALRDCLGRALLPAEQERRESSPRPLADQPADGAPKARILVAEDHRVNARLIVLLLEKQGYAVEVVGNGAEAVKAVGGGGYDLVLMDCQMPELDGYEATDAIRALEGSEQSIQIVAVTANAVQGDRQRCLDAGMDDYIAKPITGNELTAVVDRCLRRGSTPS